MADPAFDENDKNKSEQSFEELFSDSGSDKDSNELDSFFEDLTSLDENDLGIPQENNADGDNHDRMISGLLKENQKKTSAEPSSKKKSGEKMKAAGMSSQKKERLKRMLLWLVLLFLIFGLLVGLYYTFEEKVENIFKPDVSTAITPEDFRPTDQPSIIVKPADSGLDFSEAESNPSGIDQDGQFAVQVAVCVFQSCINEFRYKLDQIDYTVETRAYSVRGDFLEMISEGRFNRDEAENYASEINRINNIMGNAIIVPQNDGDYRISLGNFFYLEDFKKVKQVIEDNISDPRMVMIDSPKRQRANTFRLYVGPFADRNKADEVLEDIKKLSGLNSSFVIDLNTL